jgi:hypothetical protein
MSALRPGIARLLRNVPWWVAPLFIAACFAYGLFHPNFWPSFSLNGPYGYFLTATEDGRKLSIALEGDTQYLRDAVAAHPHFRDTLQWWYSPWYHDVPYFRPLSMLLFWGEQKLFGNEGVLWFEGIHWFWHGLFLVVLWGFLAQIAGRGRAALAVGIFAAGFNEWLQWPSGMDAFNCWKDSVDVWAASFMVLCAWAYLRYLRSGNVRWWAAMLAAWILNLSIKEAGYITPFVLALVLWYEGKIRSHWKSLLPIFMLAPCAWLYRSWALGGYGNKTGTGDAWLTRFALDGLGLPARIISGDWISLAPLALGIGVAYGLWRREKRLGKAWLPPVLGLGAAVIFLVMASGCTHIPLGDTLARFVIVDPWRDVPLCAALAGLWLLFFRERQRPQVFGLLWVWINFSPLIIQPPTSPHVYYPIAPGWSLLLACAVWRVVEKVLRLEKPASPAISRPQESVAL